MPFCPRCRYEYGVGIYICPDCNEKLVPVLDKQFDNNSASEDFGEWVILSRLATSLMAEMIRGRLEELDIPVIVASKSGRYTPIRVTDPSSIGPAGGSYTIMVPEKFADEADLEGEAILGEDWIKGRPQKT